MVSCPCCGEECRPANSYITFCDSCGHRWLVTSEAERDAAVRAMYTPNYVGYRHDPKFVDTVTRATAEEIAKRVPPPARVLDVGCGAGAFMAVAKSLGYQVEGIDISEASAQMCRSQGLEARAGDFLTEEYSEKFDLITMWDVVEHLRDPASFLERARSLLSERGYVVAIIPGFGALSVGLSNRWPRAAGTLLGAPSHIQFFTRDSLATLLSRTGLQPEWLEGGTRRTPVSGGSLKRRMARKARSAIRRLSGDESLFFAARPSG